MPAHKKKDTTAPITKTTTQTSSEMPDFHRHLREFNSGCNTGRDGRSHA